MFERFETDRAVARAQVAEILEAVDTWRVLLGPEPLSALPAMAATISAGDVDHLASLLADLRRAVGQRDRATAALDAATRLWDDLH